jgi:energy-coupling factor transporter ATP-binding protein EcfA2
MPLPTSRATDLATAYKISDVQPLTGEDLDRYYVDLGAARKNDAIININSTLELQETEQHSAILFTGHRGCGKSTELRLLQRTWQKHFHVIYLESDKITDINDVQYTDIYLLIAQYLEFEMRQLNIQLDSRIIKDIEQWFGDVIEELEMSKNIDIAVSGEITIGASSPFPVPALAKFLAKLTSQIKGSSKDKKTIRRAVEKDLSILMTSLNLLLGDAEKKLIEKKLIEKKPGDQDCKGILIVFDNLDRCPPHVADKLFFDYAAQLQSIDCNIVYTVPIASLYSSRGIAKTFDKPYIVSMVNIYEYEDKPDLLNYQVQGLNSLVELLDKRIDVDRVFETRDILLDIVRASGGHVRDLMKMVRQACLTAIGKKHVQVQADDALYAINQAQFSFEREIPDTHYPIIAETFLKKRAPSNPLGQDCLFYTYVLEYNGDRRWNYPHPTVIKIDAFQTALTQLKQAP